MIDRRSFIGTVALGILTAPLAVEAQQQAGSVRRIGVLMYQTMTDEFVPLFAAFREGLRQAGYVEGQNVDIALQDARGRHDRLTPLAGELVRLKVDAIFAVGPQALKVAKNTTGALPIVAIDLESDPVEGGFVASLARPGGNITGVFLDLPELMGKWLELVRDFTPASRVAALWDPTTAVSQMKAIEAAAKSMALRLEVFRFVSRRISTTCSELPGARVSTRSLSSRPRSCWCPPSGSPTSRERTDFRQFPCFALSLWPAA